MCVDGIDGSGKATQTDILYNRLKEEGFDVMKISFPNYEGESSKYVKNYLEGVYGNKAEDVNPYLTSMFYALDRLGSYNDGVVSMGKVIQWKEHLKNGGILISDRYVSANQIHQLSKIKGREERIKFLRWTTFTEHITFGIPKADVTILLDMDTDLVEKSIKNRDITEGHKGGLKKDIEEESLERLRNSREASLFAANELEWIKVRGWGISDDIEAEYRDRESIAEEIYNIFIEKYNKAVQNGS